MKKALRRLLMVIVVLVIGLLVLARWAQIAAKVWHWRHGYWTYVGEYVVPVPDRWLVEINESRDTVTLIDTRVIRTADRLSAVSIITAHISRPVRDLDAWASFSRQRRERDGLRDIEEKTVQAGDERMVCLGGYEFRDVMRVPGTAAVSLECQSTGRLHLMFIGSRSRLPDFYAIASQISKRK